MKVAHFCIFGPNATGMYETVKDLILCERKVGIDARMVDYGFNEKPDCRVGLTDRHITTQPMEFAEQADVVVCHSAVPHELARAKPSIHALHGRPEGSYRTGTLAHILKIAQSKRNDAFITFWPEYLFHWSRLLIGQKVFCVTPSVDFDVFKPDGNKRDFKINGNPNIVLVDMWRVSESPFYLLFASQYFKEHFAPDARLHLYGLDGKHPSIDFIKSFKKLGTLGEVSGVVRNIDDIYRSADMVVTPHNVATRSVREALATGVPVVAASGCRFTDFTANHRNHIEFAEAMNRCYKSNIDRNFIRQCAMDSFKPETVGGNMLSVFKKVLQKRTLPIWNGMSITPKDWEVLSKFVKDHGIRSVTEFGSGSSTRLLDKEGITVTSYETSQKIIDLTSNDTKKAVFRLWDGKTIPSITGDMAFIDGPHRGTSREPSYKAVFNSDIPYIACHDMAREEDRQWVRKYFSDCERLVETDDLWILGRGENVQSEKSVCAVATS